MTDTFTHAFDLSTREMDRYREVTLRRLRGKLAGARRALLNSAAFQLRRIVIEDTIPDVMTVRSPYLLYKSLWVDKADRYAEVATLSQRSLGSRYDALRAQEFGGVFETRQPGTRAERNDTDSRRIPNRFRLKGDFLSQRDITVANLRSHEQRVAVFLSMLDREKFGDPFIIDRRTSKWPRGVYMHGKYKAESGYWFTDKRNGKRRFRKTPVRMMRTIRYFKRGKQRVKKTPWMKPGIKVLLGTFDFKWEFQKLMARGL